MGKIIELCRANYNCCYQFEFGFCYSSLLLIPERSYELSWNARTLIAAINELFTPTESLSLREMFQ